MCRRKLLILTSGLALLGVAGVGLLDWITSPAPGVTWENFRRLREGMTLEHAETLLGKPAMVRFNSELEIVRWQGEGIVIRLSCYLNERLRGGEAYPQEVHEPPPRARSQQPSWR